MKPIGPNFDSIERFLKNTADNITPNEARKAVGLEPLEDVQSAELSESRREHYEPLICSRCGGLIDRESMKCHYCRTEYRSIYKTEDMEFLPETQWEKENPAIKAIKR